MHHDLDGPFDLLGDIAQVCQRVVDVLVLARLLVEKLETPTARPLIVVVLDGTEEPGHAPMRPQGHEARQCRRSLPLPVQLDFILPGP
jgi:hypothetical protein